MHWRGGRSPDVSMANHSRFLVHALWALHLGRLALRSGIISPFNWLENRTLRDISAYFHGLPEADMAAPLCRGGINNGLEERIAVSGGANSLQCFWVS